MKRKILVLVFLFNALPGQPAWAHGPADLRKPGSPERKLLLNSLHSVVQQELKKPVVFKVDHLKVQDDWAFMHGVPMQPDGKPMNYEGTPYEAAIKQGIFDNWICALLHKRQGRWHVVTYALGATDVPYADWDRRYHAPASIFQ
jgi:hypothetical protein